MTDKLTIMSKQWRHFLISVGLPFGKLATWSVTSWRNPFISLYLCTFFLLLLLYLENGRYWHAPIRSDTSIRVYVTADTDTDMSTPCVSVPATYIIIPGRSFRECSYFTQWVAHSIQGSTCRPLVTHQLAHSVTFTTGQFVETLVWLTVETVVITACWWGEVGVTSSVAGCQYYASWCRCHGEAGIRLRLPPPTPPTLSRILDHMVLSRAAGDLARGRSARRVTGANVLWSAV